MFLSYDIKGIQQFIFSVPRLRYMIGGSGPISQFDDRWLRPEQLPPKVARIFTGGGRGVFECESLQAAEDLKQLIISNAHREGFDVRIGIAERFEEVTQRAEDLYPFLPAADQMRGFPCSESGLYPVPRTAKDDHRTRRKALHPIIRRRAQLSKKDVLGRQILDRIEPKLRSHLPAEYRLEFLRNVSPELLDDDELTFQDVDLLEERDLAFAGQNCLGGRNRWAIIAMDGNEVGSHFKAICARQDDSIPQAIGVVSEAIKQITQTAMDHALVTVLHHWLTRNEKQMDSCVYTPQDSPDKTLVLPIRPILVGGDDLILICHPDLAIDFVAAMVSKFENESEKQGQSVEKTIGFYPWISASKRLTISAGVLFTRTSLPLHVAIPYAQALLSNAKGAFRKQAVQGQSVPSAVDWEVVTDSMIDHPAIRRQRECDFKDDDMSQAGVRLRLTRRPYQVSGPSKARQPTLESLQQTVMPLLAAVPTSVRHELASALRQPWARRTQFLMSMKKEEKYAQLVDMLDLPMEPPDRLPQRWFDVSSQNASSEQTTRTLATDVLDAITLLEEQHRLKTVTARTR